MRLLVAPDKFAGTLTAAEVASAVAEGWARSTDRAGLTAEIDLAPLSDGGPGFVEVVRAARGGRTLSVTVTGPLGDQVPAEIVVIDEDGTSVAYVEAAQACGLHLIPADRRDPRTTTTVGVGELIAAAVDAGAARIVVGLGGSGTNDGGAGLLAALGATGTTGADAADGTGVLLRGGGGLVALTGVDLGPARDRLAGVELVAASDVDNPLLGLDGASAVFGPQKGADRDTVLDLDDALRAFASVTDPAVAGEAGAGAAGGLGFALLLLGGRRVPGIETVLELVGLDARIAAADLVITGEGSFDWQSLRGKVVSGVAATSLKHGRPCLVLAGRVEVGRRELAAMGGSAAYSVTDQAGSAEAAMADAHRHLADLASRVAAEWARA